MAAAHRSESGLDFASCGSATALAHGCRHHPAFFSRSALCLLLTRLAAPSTALAAAALRSAVNFIPEHLATLSKALSTVLITALGFFSTRPLPVFSTPPGFRVSVDCGLVAFARSSSSLYWLAWRSLTPSCQVGWLAAAPCHLCPCLVSPSAAGNGRSWALSAWISYPGLVLVKNSVLLQDPIKASERLRKTFWIFFPRPG